MIARWLEVPRQGVVPRRAMEAERASKEGIRLVAVHAVTKAGPFGLKGEQKRQFYWALFFVAPWVIGFLVFTLGPMLVSLYYSFSAFNIVQPPQWQGLANYQKMLGQDEYLLQSLRNTLYMVVFGIPVTQLFAFATALVLNMRVRGIPFYRTLYFLPAIMPAVPVTLVWTWIFNPDLGPVNAVISALGLTPPIWMNDPDWSKPTLILLGAWQVGTTTAIYLAGLQGVPTELHEAAMIDGAGWWARLRHITIPFVSPVVAFNTIIGVIYTFQYFTQAYVASSTGTTGKLGGIENSLLFYAVYLYQNGFLYLNMGYASAMAWLLFIIVMAATLLALYGSARWVYYEVSER
jgi:multiple sugar transport system permease protein